MHGSAYRQLVERLDPERADRPGFEAECQQLEAFMRLAAEWNARLDLTAARTPAALAEILCADALILADQALLHPGERCLDVGSGAGGPALALAILRPDATFTLLEPLHKRVAFLRTVVGALGLAGRVRVVEGRVDPRRPTPPAGVETDVALSRATFDPAVWAGVGLRLAPSVLVLLAQHTIEGAPTARRDYILPSNGARRTTLRLIR